MLINNLILIVYRNVDESPIILPELCSDSNNYGRRIVDIYYVFDQIKKCVHEGTFMDMELLHERRFGLRSKFTFLCKMCKIVHIIESEEEKPKLYMPINEAAVSGSISIGIGHSQLEEICATMDIPSMTSKTYIKNNDIIGKKIHEIAENVMKIAGEEERRLAIENGDIDNNGIPMCTVVADGQWGKRSYKTKYDALSGAVSII